MANAICLECIEDIFLRQLAKADSFEGYCTVCNRVRPDTISIGQLGALLEPVIRKHYRPGDISPPDWEPNGDDIEYIVQEVFGQDFKFSNELAEAVILAEGYDPRSGDGRFFEQGMKYVAIDPSGSGRHIRWCYVENQLRTSRRFFSAAAEDFFDELFRDVDRVLFDGGPDGDRGVVTNLPTGSTVYRGRICRGDLLPIFNNPIEQVGPPPSNLVRAGRMNAEGISVFYGATDEKTCLAELRPAIGQESAIIAVRTTLSLRMLDFTRLTKAYKSLSYFQPDYDDQADKLLFLRMLGILISQPVIPGHEIEYLMTQTMMEYLAHVYRDPIEARSFDGVIFPSAQHKDGKNIVFFPRIENDTPVFPIEYVADSLAINVTRTITYEHKKTPYFLDGEKVRVAWWSEYGFAE